MICRINEDQREIFLLSHLKILNVAVSLTLDDLEFSQTFAFQVIKGSSVDWISKFFFQI